MKVRSWQPLHRSLSRTPRPDPAPMPFLHLQGRWLNRAGFAIGVPVAVRVSPGRLVIEKAEIRRVPRTEALARLESLVREDGLPEPELVEIARRLRRLSPP